MEPAWAKDFPRLYDLYRESEQDNETNYFKDFDSALTIPRDISPARSSFERLEKEIEELDEAAWQAFKQKVRKYKSYITKKHELRGYQQLFDLLNEVNGYLYLKSNGCEEVQFISEKNVTTPDLIACCGSFVVIMEVKTINESKEELDWIIENSKRPYDRLQVREVRQGLDDSLKRKMSDTVSKAKSQLLGYAAEKVDRRIVYLAIRVDTHGQSPWHFEIFKLCLTPFGRVLIHPRAKPVEPCPSGYWTFSLKRTQETSMSLRPTYSNKAITKLKLRTLYF